MAVTKQWIALRGHLATVKEPKSQFDDHSIFHKIGSFIKIWKISWMLFLNDFESFFLIFHMLCTLQM